jgi:hypothetical protein
MRQRAAYLAAAALGAGMLVLPVRASAQARTESPGYPYYSYDYSYGYPYYPYNYSYAYPAVPYGQGHGGSYGYDSDPFGQTYDGDGHP